MRNLWQRLSSIVAVAVLAGMLAGPAVQPVLAAQTGPTTWTVLVGGEAQVSQQPDGPAGAWQFMRFYPETITINAGDTVVWKLNSAEFHTVTFPVAGQQAPAFLVPEGGDSQRLIANPLAAFPQGGETYDPAVYTNSGLLSRAPGSPQEYKLTFNTAGDYAYLCAVHSMMKGHVIVQAAGAAYPKTQAQYDAEAQAKLAADAAAAAPLQAGASAVVTKPGPNGTTIYQVKIGAGDGTNAWMRFGQTDLTIHVGDTVEWVQNDPETPHTVTFNSGQTEPMDILAEPQASGPPKLVFNPVVLAPAGGATYSGTGYFNSGLLQGTQSPAPGPRSYSLAFDTPGTYEYICVLHDGMGMNGHITVVAQGAPIALPVTGGSLPFGGLVTTGMLALAALAIAAIVSGLLITRRQLRPEIDRQSAGEGRR
jgi:plastocyanin